MIANTYLNSWYGGQVEIDDDTSVGAHGRREAFLSVGDLSDMDSVRRVVAGNLNLTKDPTPSVVALLDDVDADSGYTPYGDFLNGDTLIDGAATPRCSSIQTEEDADGNLDSTIELDTARDVLEQSVNRWLSRTNNGALDGKSATAQPSVSSRSILRSEVVRPDVIGPINSDADYVLADGDTVAPGKAPDITGFLYRVEIDANDAGIADTLIDITVNGSTVCTATIAASTAEAIYDLTSSETLILEPGDIVRCVVDTGGGHSGVSIRLLIASIEI